MDADGVLTPSTNVTNVMHQFVMIVTTRMAHAKCVRSDYMRSRNREFTKGDRYRPVVTIERVRNGTPTVLKVSGRRYIYDPGTVNRHIQKRKGR